MTDQTTDGQTNRQTDCAFTCCSVAASHVAGRRVVQPGVVADGPVPDGEGPHPSAAVRTPPSPPTQRIQCYPQKTSTKECY